MYFVIDALERLMSPRGYDPITALHGGEPVGRKVMNWLGIVHTKWDCKVDLQRWH